MKKIFYILIFLCGLSSYSFAQDQQQPDEGAKKVRERMIEYIENKLGLTKDEAEKFTPVYIEYFRELRQTNQEYKNDPLLRQQKIADLRLRYRDQFKPILGEKRSNEVFQHEREFVQKAIEIRNDRLQNRQEGRAKRFKALL